MADVLKHVLVLGLALPVGIGGYHLAVGNLGRGTEAASGTAEAADMEIGRHGYQLSALPVLDKDVYRLESKYVERERLDPEKMFDAALDQVEKDVAEVMFEREPGGRRLSVSVGDYATVVRVDPMKDLGDMATQLRKVATVLEQHLSPEVDQQAVEYGLINGALSTLDPHTILMPPEQAQEMDVDNRGEFGGLGIEIMLKEGRLSIKQPIADTPASRAGLKAKDQIVRIDGESTINMDLNDAVTKLRGRKGDPVTLGVMRTGLSEPRAYTIIRDTIKLNPVEGELLEGNIGYIQIKAFHEGVGEELQTLLARFTRESGAPLRGVVLDLRGDPGGYLKEAEQVGDAFLSDGVIVTTVDGGTGRRDENRATRAGTAPNYPIAVLVNGNSASASEIVAGALRNQDRAVIIGERTFGKGSVQNLYNHDDGSRLKLTVAKYLTPGDRSIQAVGIPPDIALKPSLVEAAPAGDDDQTPRVSLYWREWIDREADLSNVLSKIDDADMEPAWTVRYLRERDDDGEDVNAQSDWEVQFAREVLLAAPGYRRPEVLSGAGGVVARHGSEEQSLIQAAFAKLGIDWSAGPLPTQPQIDVHLDLGPDDQLVAGQSEDIGLVVTNLGTEPVFQLSAVSTSDNPYLDHREFYFGRLAPGETRRVAARVKLQDGYPTELAAAKIQLRTPDDDDLADVQALVHTQGRPLPAFSYEVALRDDGSGDSKGNGNGIPEVGETIDLQVTVHNIGEGPSGEAFARLRNRAGRSLDLMSGNLDVGEPRDAQGLPCKAGADGCHRVLQPGESWTGALSFALREAPTDGHWDADLQVGDSGAYDFASIQRGGFFDYFQLEESLELQAGEVFKGALRQPPRIAVTRGPGQESADTTVVVSGLVTDDQGLRDVMIFHGSDKVFYRGGGQGETSLPFSVERPLQPGSNLIVILARDAQGLTATRAVDTWYQAPAAQPQASTPGENSAG